MFRQQSLSRRLLLAAMAFIALAIMIAAVAVGFVLHRFIQGEIDQRLDTQVTFLTSLLRVGPDGTISLSGSADGPPFERPRRGWYWQIDAERNVLRSLALDGANLDAPDIGPDRRPPPPAPPNGDRPPRERGPRPADGPGPDEGPLPYPIQRVVVADTPATIVVAAPRAAVWDPLREALTTLLVSLGILGIALVLSVLLQVRLGLRPLERLRQSVADVRAGRAERVPSPQPIEVAPLVTELNALLQQNDANLERARRHVANLAHGLKTPLATLAVSLSSRDGGQAAHLIPIVDLMERRIRHHLGRARAAALAGPARSLTEVAPRVRDLADVLLKIHAERAISVVLEIPPGTLVACEQQDFDEMAGNLMENAFKWTHSRIAVQATSSDRMTSVVIDDDGP